MSPNKGLFSVNYKKLQAKLEINHYLGEKINWKIICTTYHKGPLPLIHKECLQTKKKCLKRKMCIISKHRKGNTNEIQLHT